MKEIIAELRSAAKHERLKIGLTPHTSFKGTQRQHDGECRRRAANYLKAIKILENYPTVISSFCTCSRTMRERS